MTRTFCSLRWALALLLLGVAGDAEAALQVVTQGPRSGAVGVGLRQAFAEAGIGSARVVVQTRRGRPSWGVSVSVFRVGERQPVLVVGLRARAGHVAAAALARIAKRAAALLSGRAKPDAKPDPPPNPETPPEPAADEPPEAPAPAPKPTPPTPESKPAEKPAERGPNGGAPKPAKPAESDLEFDTEPEEKPADAKPADEKPARPRARAARVQIERRGDPVTLLDRVVVRVNAGVGLAHRRFLLDWVAAGVDYETGLYSQVFAHGEVYPLQLLTANPIARLGLRLDYASSAGLSTDAQPGNPQSERLTTTVRRFGAALTFLFPPFRNKAAPRFDLRFGLHHTDFEIDANLKIKDLSLTTLAPGAGITFPFRSYLSFAASAEYRALIRVRNEIVERYAPGTAALQGVSLEAAVQGKIFAGLGYKGSFTYERLAGDLPDPAGGQALIMRDRYMSGDLALSYEF